MHASVTFAAICGWGVSGWAAGPGGGTTQPVAATSPWPQENFFFDGAGQELSSRRVVLRVRFYNHDKKAVITVKVRALLWVLLGGCWARPPEARCAAATHLPVPTHHVLAVQASALRPAALTGAAADQRAVAHGRGTCGSVPPLVFAPPCNSRAPTPPTHHAPLQGKQVLQDGIGRAPEQEEEADPALARSFLAEPAKLLGLGTPLLEGLKRWGAGGGCAGQRASRLGGHAPVLPGITRAGRRAGKPHRCGCAPPWRRQRGA